MEVNPNRKPIEVFKAGTFGGTYFGTFTAVLRKKWYKNSWKEFDQLKNIDQKYYSSDYNDVSVNKCGVKCRTTLRFWENKGWIRSLWLVSVAFYVLVR